MSNIKSLEEEINGDVLQDFSSHPEEVEVQEEKRGIDLSGVVEKLRTPTGEGTIEEYLEHPLNFKKSRGIAQMLRGFTGMFGALNLAVIDIVMGAMNLQQEKTSKGGGSHVDIRPGDSVS